MALKHSIRVPVPNRTYRKKRGDSTYVYYYTSFFTKDNGKHSNTSVLIGKLDNNDSSKLIPNDHYYEYFDHSSDIVELPEIVFEGDFSIGYSAAVNQIFKDLGLDVILKDNFGPAAYDIMTVASYSIKNGAVMSYIDDYTKYHYDINNPKVLTNQRVSDLFASITYQQRMDFFMEWIDKCRANECFVYDVSSISSYSEGIEQAEFGYNRDHDDLRQINIGLFSGINSKLPVYYENYNGSLTDKVNLIPVLKNAQAIGIEEAHIVMDGGFFDEKRIKELDATGLTFTVGMPATLDKSRELLEKYRNEIRLMKNRTSYASNYAKMYDTSIYGIEGRVMIGLNTQTQDLMMETLKKDINKREKELREKRIKKYSTVIKKKRYTDLFEIIQEGENGYTYKLKEDEIQEKANNYGYFLVFTTDVNASADDILYYYREKDIDEKMFYQLKNYEELNRLRTHNQKTTDGKIFNLFVSLIIRNYMQQKLKSYMNINHLTLEKCILKLEDIKMIKIKGQQPRLLKELTKQQKELLKILGVDINKTLENT